MIKKQLTRNDLEAARAQTFHMILFAMAWVMIGEYGLHFRDYAVAAGIVLAAVVILGLETIKMYDLEDELPDSTGDAVTEAHERKRRSRLSIFLFEGAAIMATWMILLRSGRLDRLVPGFSLIAGMHFFPLARVGRFKSYYLLGAWICVLALTGYLLSARGILPDAWSNALIAYGCAAGGIIEGASIAMGTKSRRK
jgi:hypothetical protein